MYFHTFMYLYMLFSLPRIPTTFLSAWKSAIFGVQTIHSLSSSLFDFPLRRHFYLLCFHIILHILMEPLIVISYSRIPERDHLLQKFWTIFWFYVANMHHWRKSKCHFKPQAQVNILPTFIPFSALPIPYLSQPNTQLQTPFLGTEASIELIFNSKINTKTKYTFTKQMRKKSQLSP